MLQLENFNLLSRIFLLYANPRLTAIHCRNLFPENLVQACFQQVRTFMRFTSSFASC